MMETGMRRPKAVAGHGRGPLPLAIMNGECCLHSLCRSGFVRILFRLLEIRVVTDSPLQMTFGAGLDF